MCVCVHALYIHVHTQFDVEWPEMLKKAILWVKGTVKFDVLQLPTLSCLWNGIEYWTTVRTYTLAPLGLFVALAIPMLAARIRKFPTNAPKRYRDTVDRFWTNSMFALFFLCT